MFDIMSVGSATVDLFTRTNSKYIQDGRYCFSLGSKILVDKLEFSIGGGGVNTAISFSRLGLKTAFLGKIGKKTNAQRIINFLKKEKVNTELVQREQGRTGFSIIIDSPQSDRTILTFKGSNNQIEFNHINKNKLKTKWFYFSSALGKTLSCQKRLAIFAKEHNINLAINLSEYTAKLGLKKLNTILKNTTILVLNKVEAKLLTKHENTKDQLKSIHKAGPKIIVITNGGKAIYASDNNKSYIFKPNKIIVKETTGAGDAFASTFITGIIRTNDIQTSLKMATINSQSVATHMGATNRLLRWSTLVKKIRV